MDPGSVDRYRFMVKHNGRAIREDIFESGDGVLGHKRAVRGHVT